MNLTGYLPSELQEAVERLVVVVGELERPHCAPAPDGDARAER
jgi:hypothetical protein